MARFRRKSRGTWFPMLGTTRFESELQISFTLQQMELTIPTGIDEPVVGVLPITLDEPQDSNDQSSDTKGIGEFIGNEYIVKRVVGQLFLSRTTTTSEAVGTDWPDVLVTSGFFVARAADGNDDFTDHVPVGWTTTDAWRNYSPQATQNIREPWMWRRSWILGHRLSGQPPVGVAAPATAINTTVADAFPVSNVYYPNMSDHRVDIKSRRRVRQDERLWWVVGAIPRITTFGVDQVVIRASLDARVFGDLRKPRAHGSF